MDVSILPFRKNNSRRHGQARLGRATARRCTRSVLLGRGDVSQGGARAARGCEPRRHGIESHCNGEATLCRATAAHGEALRGRGTAKLSDGRVRQCGSGGEGVASKSLALAKSSSVLNRRGSVVQREAARRRGMALFRSLTQRQGIEWPRKRCNGIEWPSAVSRGVGKASHSRAMRRLGEELPCMGGARKRTARNRLVVRSGGAEMQCLVFVSRRHGVELRRQRQVRSRNGQAKRNHA